MDGRRSAARFAAWTGAVLLLVVVALAAAVGIAVRASVPQLDGHAALAGTSAPVRVARDALGTAVVRGATRLDVARGLGFVHAQERFFEMDLARRSAAGELSALFGRVALPRDRERRLHRWRASLEGRVGTLPADQRSLLESYAAGVNAGLAALPVRPWQYLLLQSRPAPWRPADSLLVIGEMYWMLQADTTATGFERAWLRERAGDAVYAFLEPTGGRWDAALDGSTTPDLALPTAAQLDVHAERPAPPASPAVSDRASPRTTVAATWLLPPAAEAPDVAVGSNSWAVSGAHTATGAALLANDMHLGLGVPSIWFRAQLEFGTGAGAVRAAGVTLPGVPAIVAGDNGALAWGFTNAYGRWFDWLEVPAGAHRAITEERIAVKGAADDVLRVETVAGAPVVRHEGGRDFALRWIADDPAAIDLGLDGLLAARSVDAGLAVAQRAGIPHQNILLADAAGHAGWTIAGRLWAGDRRPGLARFVDATAPAPGWRDPADAPRLLDPAGGRLWTANARQLGGDAAAAIGDGGFDLGARAQQIRDRLRERERLDEADFDHLHFDDEARFLRTWRERLQPVADDDPAHAERAALLRAWNGRADADQAGYRLLRETRRHALDALWVAWTTPALGARQADAAHRLPRHPMFEYAADAAIDARAPHLLPAAFASWDDFLRAQLAAAADEMTGQGATPLEQATWGAANASRLRHVLARAVPALSRWLDAPSLPQSGDGNLPHVAAPSFGQSERLVVSPGHEDRATLVVAGGQSGHPLSPYYLAGQADWAAGRTEPLLAGPARHVLVLGP